VYQTETQTTYIPVLLDFGSWTYYVTLGKPLGRFHSFSLTTMLKPNLLTVKYIVFKYQNVLEPIGLNISVGIESISLS